MDTHQHRPVTNCLLASLTFMFGCSDGSGTAEGTRSVSASQGLQAGYPAAISLHKKVRLEVDNDITLRALPNATCQLYADDAKGSGQSLDLYSDDEGQIPLNFRPTSGSSVAKLTLECQDAQGVTANYHVELEATADAPALIAPSPQGHARPPLTGDPLALSVPELVAMGYPPRPDPVVSPEAYKRWLDDASRPMTMITPKAVQTSRRADRKTTNWVGAASVSTTPFRQTRAYWTMPTVTGESNNADSLAIWAGIGGYDSSAMWQGGTSQDWYNAGTGYIWQNGFWFELIAADDCCGMVTLTGFNIQPGDAVVAQLWVGDSAGNVNINGDRGWWYMANNTKNIATQDWGGASYHVPFPAGTPMTGATVEWVAERPLIGRNPTVYAHLAKFGSMYIMGEADTTGNNTWYWYAGLTPTNLGMYRLNSNGTWGPALATASFADTSHIKLTWKAYD